MKGCEDGLSGPGELSLGFATLEGECADAGFAMLSRLRGEWPQAFPPDRAALFAVAEDDCLAGLGGIAPDPYDNALRRGRLRHFYVTHRQRRSGIGAMLLGSCMTAVQHFDLVCLRTPGTAEAARFYEANGFIPAKTGSTSHLIHLR